MNGKRTDPKESRRAEPGTPTTSLTGRRRRGLSVYAALVALSAYGGALGLVTGVLELPAYLDQRLPFGSPAVGAAALTLWVAVPATVLMVLAWNGHHYAPHAAVLDGLLLIAWILVEYAFLREVSFLHVFYLAVGAGLVACGRSAVPELAASARHARLAGTVALSGRRSSSRSGRP